MFKVNRVLIPIDLSSRSGPAVEHGVNIADHFGAEVIFLHVVPPVTSDAAQASGYPGGLTSSSQTAEELEALLDEFLQKKAPGVEGEQVVVKGDPVLEIVRLSEAREIDLIVMPTAGGGVFRRFVMGSVAAKVLGEVSCPVLTGVHVESLSVFASEPYRRVGCSIELEGSGQKALGVAGAFAKAYGAEVTGIHAISPYESPASGSIEEGAKAAVAKVLAKADVASPPVVEFGSAEEVLPQAARDRNLDLLVVERREDPFDVIRKSPCPVLSV